MAAILFLAPEDLGEAVLATGALAHALQSGGRLVVVCAEPARPLFRAAPGLVASHVLARRASWRELWRVAGELSRTRFDVSIDARGGWLGQSLKIARRLALKPAPVLRHRSEDWAEALGAERALAPRLWIDAQARADADAAVQGPIVAIAPGGAGEAKRWPAERFAAVARRLVGGPLAQARVVVLGAGARDREITRAVAQSLEADGVSVVDLGAQLDLLACAALMERATLCLGNDNALTHIAAAAGAPTLALYGPTDERVRGPFGARVRTMRGRSLEEIAAAPSRGSAMEAIGIDAVEAAALDLLHAGGLR
ncbi:MAG TPA: glycosyltransferase family 9 protein [Terricaulis sp.]|nr:glycosyltransferase family 9 protein [Terricaulis sp.]